MWCDAEFMTSFSDASLLRFVHGVQCAKALVRHVQVHLVEVPTTCTSWSWKSRKIRKSCLCFAVRVHFAAWTKTNDCWSRQCEALSTVPLAVLWQCVVPESAMSLSLFFSFLHFFHSVRTRSFYSCVCARCRLLARDNFQMSYVGRTRKPNKQCLRTARTPANGILRIEMERVTMAMATWDDYLTLTSRRRRYAVRLPGRLHNDFFESQLVASSS